MHGIEADVPIAIVFPRLQHITRARLGITSEMAAKEISGIVDLKRFLHWRSFHVGA